MDDSEQGSFPGAGRQISLALNRGGTQFQALVTEPEVDRLVSQGTQDVTCERRILGAGGQLQCQAEVPVGQGLFAIVECHPPRKVDQLAYCGEHVAPHLVSSKPAGKKSDRVRSQVLNDRLPGVPSATGLIELREHDAELADRGAILWPGPLLACSGHARLFGPGLPPPGVRKGERRCRADRASEKTPAVVVSAQVRAPQIG